MRIVVVVALCVVAGCSRPPSQIKPIAAVGQPFATYTCEQLVAERASYAERLEVSKETQRGRAAGDVVLGIAGGALLLAAGKAAAGQDEEQNIGTYRGAIIEIDAESRRKACSDPSFFRPEPAPPKPQQSLSGPAPT